MKLEGRGVLVTGGARRVGRALAKALAERGAMVAVHYNRSRSQAASLARELESSFGRRAVAVAADLSDPRAAQRLAGQAARRLGRLDVLINNASLYRPSVFGRTSVRDWDDHLDANLRAPFLLSQAAAPHLRRQGEGRIVNIADWAGLRPYADYIPYCVSKAGLLCLTQALAKALAPRIRVNAVMPGPVLLPEGFGRARARAVAKATLVKRLGQPQDVVHAVLYLLERGDFVTGAAIPVDGGRLIA